MGFWSDAFGWGNAPTERASVEPSAPEVRSDEPTLPQPNVDEALRIPTRADYKYNVSEGEALGLIALFRGAQVISTSVMQLSFDAFRADEQLDPKPLLLRKPDSDESLSAFLEKTTLSLVLNGNAFWRVFRDNQGRVVGLRVLNPNDVVIKTDNEGAAIAYGYKNREYTKQEIKHLSHMRVPGDPRGRGPIQAAQAELRGALDGRDYGANFFQDAGVPSGILSSDQPLNPDTAKLLSEQWTATRGGTRGTAVLGSGYSYHPIYLSPEDAQWLQARSFDVTAIARLLGVPAALMLAAVEGSSMTYSNIQQAWTEFQRFTLVRYVVEIEDALSDILPRGTEVKANIEALLRPDSVTRYQQHAVALQAGFLSINEVRAIEGLEPAPDGDFKTAEQKVAEAQAFAAPAPEEEPEEASDES